MFSHEYLALGLIMSLLAGYQYLEWKLTFQCSSSTWGVCFSCLFKNSNVLYRSAMSSVTFLPLQVPFIFILSFSHFFILCFSLPSSSWWLQLSGEPRRSRGRQLGRHAQLGRWGWIFWPSDCQTLWWRGENMTSGLSVSLVDFFFFFD